MAIVKGLKGTIVGLTFFLSTVMQVAGQNFTEVQTAFSESYKYEAEKDYSKAIEILTKVYQSESYEFNIRLGWLNYLAGMYPESSVYYQKAIALKPFSVEAKLGYTYPLSMLGNVNEIRKQYEKILEIAPMNTVAHYNLGMIEYNAADYPSALKHFEKVVNQYPFDYDGTIMFAWTHFKLGKLREAEILFNKALLMKPGDESALEGLKLVQ
jgi:tetratricopeptide (TPR) repeat protein